MDPSLWSPRTFLSLPPALTDPATAQVFVLPVPYDSTTSFRSGARGGPSAILEASRSLEDYDPEAEGEPCQVGIHTLPDLEPLVEPERMVRRVQEVVSEIARRGKFPLLLGGEHSLTVGAVRGLLPLVPDLSVLYLDAHADFRDSYQGSPYSHACTARRISEACPLALVGVRSLSGEERRTLAERGVPLLLWREGRSGEEAGAWALSALSRRVYISVDLDVLDPSVMPAVGTPEPGGMGWYDLLALLRRVAREREVVGMDIVELAPQEGPMMCAVLAARLAYKAIGYAVWARRPVPAHPSQHTD